MSEIILRFWPKNEHVEIKVNLIKEKLLEADFLGNEVDYWNTPAFKPGREFNNFFEPDSAECEGYIESLFIVISEDGYGVLELEGEEDFTFIDRSNVVSIFQGDGTFERWKKFTHLLEEITGDEYQGGWDLL